MADAYAFRSRIHPDDLERVDKSIDDSENLWDCQFRTLQIIDRKEAEQRGGRFIPRTWKNDDGEWEIKLFLNLS